VQSAHRNHAWDQPHLYQLSISNKRRLVTSQGRVRLALDAFAATGLAARPCCVHVQRGLPLRACMGALWACGHVRSR